MARYGYIQTADNVREQLKKMNRDYEGRRTWSQLYGSVDLHRQLATSQATYDYSSAIGEAYKSAYNEKAAIASSNLGSGYKDAAIEDIDLALSQAYDSYRANYLQQVAGINTSAAEATSEIDTLLTDQASKVKAYQDKPYEYLEYLYDLSKDTEKHKKDDTIANLFANDALWSRYLSDKVDDEGNRLLLSRQELYKEFYDGQGNLTIKGADFYDQMLNQFSYEDGSKYSFDAWLASNDEKLYDWSRSYNPYDYAPNTYGNSTNKASMRTMFGLTSSDEKYLFIERFGGMSETEVKSLFTDFQNAVTDLQNRAEDSNGRDSKQITEDVKSMVNNIKTLTVNLGISDEIENELGVTWDELAAIMESNYNNSVKNGDIWWQGILTTAGTTASFAMTGATIGSKVVPGKGTLAGGAAGGIAGLITGIITACIESHNTTTSNKELANASVDAYAELVSALTDYAMATRAQKERDFYKS